ncbi:MAG: helix-hairpin-helix domain-containing protein [Pseudomonadota bacterium]
MHWDRRQARYTLLLFLLIFAAGQVKQYLARPVFPHFPAVFESWPPEGSLLDATALKSSALKVFQSATTVAKAVRSLGLKADPLGSGRCLPPAGVLIKGVDGWSIRPMTQRERWVWRIPMDLYRCRPEDLMRINGIGPSLAERIYRFVQDRGYLGSLDALNEIPGIGPGKIKQLKQELEIP